MARITQIKFTAGRTISLGNYNSARIDYEETVDLDETDDVAKEQNDLRARVWGRIITESNVFTKGSS